MAAYPAVGVGYDEFAGSFQNENYSWHADKRLSVRSTNRSLRKEHHQTQLGGKRLLLSSRPRDYLVRREGGTRYVLMKGAPTQI
jgi:hypothetical protein